MKQKESEKITGWDAREGYTKELCWRGHLVLDSDQNNVKRWFETLSDFYDWASCAVKRDFTDELHAIERLLYTNKIQDRFLSEKERKVRRDRAYRNMRALFREIQKELWQKGMYVPLYEKDDPTQAMKRMNV